MHVLRRQNLISYLYEGAERAVRGVVCDQEPHVLVAQFHWSGAIHGGQGTRWPIIVIFVIYIQIYLILSEQTLSNLKRETPCMQTATTMQINASSYVRKWLK